MTSDLGKNIRAERKRQKISLQELASRVQVTSSFLSQVENGKNEPSLSTLKKISTCLDVTVSKLLGENEYSKQVLIKKNTRNRLENLGDGLAIEFLSAFNPENNMEVCIHELAPGGVSGVVPYSHAGQEVFLVLQGAFSLIIEDQTFDMEEGDAVYLNDATKLHAFKNLLTDRSSQMLCVVNPPYFYRSKN